MALTLNRTAPTDPQAEFDARLAEQLKELGALRRELDKARSDLADATVQNLTDGSGLDKVGRLDKRVADLDRQVEAKESVVDRARAVQRKFMAHADAATMEALQKQRAEIRSQWEQVVRRELAVVAELAELAASAGRLEQEDQVAVNLEHDLRDRSLGRGRVTPGITGGADVAVEPKFLLEALAFAKQAAIP